MTRKSDNQALSFTPECQRKNDQNFDQNFVFTSLSNSGLETVQGNSDQIFVLTTLSNFGFENSA